MMRRKNTSRRVQTFSSVSIRSDEIAATDIAMSCEWPRDADSDIGVGAFDCERAFIGHSWPLGAAKSIGPCLRLATIRGLATLAAGLCGRAKAAVTKAIQGARI